MTVLLNLAITFLIPGIAIGGHLGGLAAGLAVGYLMFDVAERRRLSSTLVYGVSIVLGIVLGIGAVVAAQSAARAWIRTGTPPAGASVIERRALRAGRPGATGGSARASRARGSCA